jgi:hypothetical protein
MPRDCVRDRSIRREMQEMSKLATLASAILSLSLLALISAAASAKDIRFWNLTLHTVTSLQLSPAGKSQWGPNQTVNDRDRTVDHDERLKITDTAPGIYDVKLVDQSGRTCVVSNIQVKAEAVFSVEEKDLKDCAK